MDQGGRLKRLAGRQPARQRGGQAAQLRIDDRQQFRRRLDVRRGRPSPCSAITPPLSRSAREKKIENRDSPGRLFRTSRWQQHDPDHLSRS